MNVLRANGQTWFVDDDNISGPWDGTQQYPFNNITSALFNALSGDAIFALNGTYNERLNITSEVALRGENKHATIIDGNKTGNAIQVTANNVNISGFTIQLGGPDPASGILIMSASGNHIDDNIIRDCFTGVRLYTSANTSVSNNIFSDCDYGITISGSTNSIITENNVVGSSEIGIRISDSNNINVSGDYIAGGGFGVALMLSNNCTILNNTINLCNDGIYLVNSGENTLSANTVSECLQHGIRLSQSNRNSVTNNNVSSSDMCGIIVDSSSLNLIEQNMLLNNQEYGLRLRYSESNMILGNTMLGNSVSGYISQAFYSSNNTFFHNNFLDLSLSSVNSTNFFSANGEGNYWSDYNGTDSNSDAIGDSPYIIDANNQDRYPLMGNFSVFKVAYAGMSYAVFFISNSVISQFGFNETIRMLQFSTANFNETTSFCRITVPEQLINRPHVVIVNEVEINATLPFSNATCTSVYFVYNQNSQVKILSKPYYELLVDYMNLLLEYYNLTDKYRQLEDDFKKLSDDYFNLSSTNWSLQENLSLLQGKYDELYQQYLDVDFRFTRLNLTYSNLLAQHELLNINFTTLQLDLTRLQESHSNLSQRLQDTLSLLEQLRMESEGMKTYEDRLLYSLIAAGVTVALLSAILVWNVRLVRRQKMLLGKYGKYETELRQMSHIEAARVRFETDVIRRHEKIEKFEEKYGITIKPRSRLEDAITSLELEEEKRK